MTGTPFSTSLNQLKHQSSVLGQSIDGLHLKRSRLRGAAVALADGSAVASADRSAAVTPASEVVSFHFSFRNQEGFVAAVLVCTHARQRRGG